MSVCISLCLWCCDDDWLGEYWCVVLCCALCVVRRASCSVCWYFRYNILLAWCFILFVWIWWWWSVCVKMMDVVFNLFDVVFSLFCLFYLFVILYTIATRCITISRGVDSWWYWCCWDVFCMVLVVCFLWVYDYIWLLMWDGV